MDVSKSREEALITKRLLNYDAYLSELNKEQLILENYFTEDKYTLRRKIVHTCMFLPDVRPKTFTDALSMQIGTYYAVLMSMVKEGVIVKKNNTFSVKNPNLFWVIFKSDLMMGITDTKLLDMWKKFVLHENFEYFITNLMKNWMTDKEKFGKLSDKVEEYLHDTMHYLAVSLDEEGYFDSPKPLEIEDKKMVKLLADNWDMLEYYLRQEPSSSWMAKRLLGNL